MGEMGFTPCKLDPDVWIHDAGDCYEFVCIYVDESHGNIEGPQCFLRTLLITMTTNLKVLDPQSITLEVIPTMILMVHMHGEPRHASRNYSQTLKSLLENYQENGLHHWIRMTTPRLNNSHLLDEADIKKYQSLIGSLNWAITIGCFDIIPAVVALSTFCTAPRAGHLEQIKHVCGYLHKHPDAAIQFRTNIPDHESLYEMPDFSWLHSVYADVKEET